MATLPALSYTSRDFDVIKESLRAHLAVKFPLTWRDFYEDSMGMAWLELVAYSYSILSYMLDYSVNEQFLPTAQDRENVVKICRLVGYKLRSPVAASVVCVGSIETAQLADVVVPIGTQVSSSSGLKFEFLAEGRISAGSLSADMTLTQGETKIDTYTSLGTSFQRFLLTQHPVIYQSISVEVNGVEWSEEDSLVYGDGDSTIFAVVYDVDQDGNDVAYVEFGDGTSGAVPPSGSTIAVTYRIGGGVEGNIGLNQLQQTADGVVEGLVPVTTVSVSLINSSQRGSGGLDHETSDSARYWAPQWVHTNGRAVTEADFDVLATRFTDTTYGTPAYAKAELRQEVPELNTVDLYLWSTDALGNPTTPSAGLSAVVQAYFDNNAAGAVRVICADCEVQDGTNLYVDLSVRVGALPAYTDSQIIQDVRAAVATLFESSTVLPGVSFKLSALYRVIQAVPGVEYVILIFAKAGLRQQQSLGTGNGVQTLFAGTFGTQPILEQTVIVQAGAQMVADDGSGALSGDGIGTVDYTTGVVSVTWGTAPALGDAVTATSRYLKQYQRSSLEGIADGTVARYRGSIDNPPVVPSTFAITDGTQVAIDNGSGGLINNVDLTGNNTLDVDTGSYDVTFAVLVITGAEIRTTYRQYLELQTGNIPVDKSELAVLGNLSITVIEA